jgi:integrase
VVADFRKMLDGAAIRAGFSEPVIRGGEAVKDKRGKPVLRSTVKTHMLRHTFTAARLQTLDRGAPVSTYAVARELGHGGDALVKRIYGHLGELRHRAEVVEYRIEQHEERLRERLGVLTALA